MLSKINECFWNNKCANVRESKEYVLQKFTHRCVIIDDGKEMMYFVSTDVLLSVLNFLLLNTQGGRNKFILSEAKNSYFLH